MSSLVLFKAGGALLLFTMAFAAGMLPRLVGSGQISRRGQATASCMISSSAGVLVASGLCNMLPESAKDLRKAWTAGVPYAHILCGACFLFLTCMEHASAYLAVNTKAREPMALDTSAASDSHLKSKLVLDCESKRFLGDESDLPTARSLNIESGSVEATHAHAQQDLAIGNFVANASALVGLSLHSVLEGLGIGAGSSALWGPLGAVMTHKAMISYAIGSALAIPGPMQDGSTGIAHIRHIAGFAAMTPVGIGLGMLAQHAGSGDATENGVAAACVAITAGSLLYTCFMELLPRALASSQDGGLKLVSLMLGFIAAVVVAAVAG